METLINLLAVLYILAAPFLFASFLGKWIWPIVLAVVYTLTSVIASGMIYTPGFGYGGWLMLTLPFSPGLLLYGWLMIKLWIRWSSGAVSPSVSSHNFGRSQPSE